MNKTIQVELVSNNEFSGPVVKYDNGHKQWYLNGRLHRENGLAVTFLDGTEEYWLKRVLVKRKTNQVIVKIT
jgi:hypothetical protein